MGKQPCWCDGEIISAQIADILENIKENSLDDEDDESSEVEESKGASSDSEDDN